MDTSHSGLYVTLLTLLSRIKQAFFSLSITFIASIRFNNYLFHSLIFLSIDFFYFNVKNIFLFPGFQIGPFIIIIFLNYSQPPAFFPENFSSSFFKYSTFLNLC